MSPKGTPIHGEGVQPGVVVRAPEEDTAEEPTALKRDPVLDKALELLRETARKRRRRAASGRPSAEQLAHRHAHRVRNAGTAASITPPKAMGLDFGYNHPTALVRVYWHEKDIDIEPVIYESYLTTTQLIERFNSLGISKTDDIFADYARPEIIAELKTAGYNVSNANKVVKKGIDNVKSFGVFCQDDPRLKKEYDNTSGKR